MKGWFLIGCLVVAFLVVPAYVHWLRHRPHRLTQPTQHILLAGLLTQLVLVGTAWLLWWLL